VSLPRRFLSADEEVLLDSHPHWAFFAGPTVVTLGAAALSVAAMLVWPSAPLVVAGLLAAVVLVPMLWLVGRLYRWLTTNLVITTERVACRRGLGWRRVVEVRMRRITKVDARRSLRQRIVGTGSLVLVLEDGRTWSVAHVSDPVSLAELLDRVRTRHGTPPEPAILDRPDPAAPLGAPRPSPARSLPEEAPAQARPTVAATAPSAGVPASGVDPAHAATESSRQGAAFAAITDPSRSPAAPPGGAASHGPSPRAPAARARARVVWDPASAGATPTVGSNHAAPAGHRVASVPQQIRELAELCELGILSQEEFEEKKRELLRRM
jgi:hypothetical protein